ncbi:MAG: hypothetical protein P8Y66_02355 [Nitrospirota bacterium]|jgi:hypothetical protein
MSEETREKKEIRIGSYMREKTPLWFVIGSLLVAAWALYYVIAYWGGSGPGVGY